MSIKQIEIVACDFCGNEIMDNYLTIHVPGVGIPSIKYILSNDIVKLETTDFCNLECFYKYLKKELEQDEENEQIPM